MGFQPNFYLLCVVCLQRPQKGKFQSLPFMSSMRGKTNNVHPAFPSAVCHLDIPRIRIVTIQCRDNGTCFRWLHEKDRMSEPLRKALFIDLSSLVASCYWTWWSAVQWYSLHVAPRKHQKKRNIYDGSIHEVNIFTSELLSAEGKEILCLNLREINLRFLYWTIVRPVPL